MVDHVVTRAAVVVILRKSAVPVAAARAGASAGGGFRGGRCVEPMASDDHARLHVDLRRHRLKGWDGDTGVLARRERRHVGETTAAKPLKANTFLIWRGGQPKDFELKLEYRLNATNSGIQYRSVEVPDAGQVGAEGLPGGLDFDNRWTGQLYEEKGRGFLALRGQATASSRASKPRVIGEPREAPTRSRRWSRSNDWNQFHIIARGSTLDAHRQRPRHGVVVDDDAKGRAMSGLIGFQIHTGPPMKVEFRNICLKQ